jgi:ABC-2 type transport system ATP-binding protein
MEVVADGGVTVLLSSHIVADLERVCDHLVILAEGGVQLAGPLEEILASHRLLTGPRSEAAAAARVHAVVQESHTGRQATLLVRADGHVYDACWQIDEVGLEEIVLAYLGRRTAPRSASSEPAHVEAAS